MGNLCPSAQKEDKYLHPLNHEMDDSLKATPSPPADEQASDDAESSSPSAEPSPLVLHKDLKLNLQHISEREGEQRASREFVCTQWLPARSNP